METLEQLCANLEIKTGDDEDRISLLPDCVILEILSRLPNTEDIIRTACLSKRWTHLWALLPNLIFINNNYDFDSRHDFFSFVDKTITNRSHHLNLKLNKFQLHTCYSISLESKVNNCIRYAISCNVQDLDLSLTGACLSYVRIVLDELLFINSNFTHLKLSCRFVNPTGVFSWKNLKSLSLSKAELNEDFIQNIFSGSPLLETFKLDNCYGFSKLHITSKSVNNCVISGNDSFMPEYLEVSVPDILSLTIQGHRFLWATELENVSSLVEANFLDYAEFDEGNCYEAFEEDMLEQFIQQLRHVKELKLGTRCLEVVSRMEAKGYIVPSIIKRVVNYDSEGEDIIDTVDGTLDS